MREYRVPCRFASRAEVIAGRHMTWNDDRLCDRCMQVSAHSHRAPAATVSATVAPAETRLLPASRRDHADQPEPTVDPYDPANAVPYTEEP